MLRNSKILSSNENGVVVMRRQRAFRVASGVALLAWVGTALAAVLVAAWGVIGLSGGEYHHRVDVLGLRAGFVPSWAVQQSGEVCDRVDVRQPAADCYNIVLEHGEEPPDVLRQGDVRPVDAVLEGRLALEADPGWNPLMASLYGMQALSLLVLAFLLAQLWLMLRAAGRGQGFTAPTVRRVRLMGVVLVAWEVVEPVLWLFLSPKAHDYHEVTFGPGQHLELGSMEPGGPSITVIAFGLLLLLLAELFRHGADLAEEQELTV